METDNKRQLKIKSGIVKRITREHDSYLKEIQREKDRLEKLRDDSAEDHIIRKQEEVIQESIQMIPNTKKRLQDALEELNNFMKDNDTQQELISSEEWTEANIIIEQSRNVFS